MLMAFITRESEQMVVEQLPLWHTVICCSASRREVGDGDSYVQGAGDDTENWARGLTPEMFWRHHAELLSNLAEEELEEIVDRVVGEERQRCALGAMIEVQPLGSSVPFHIGTENALSDSASLQGLDAIICCGWVIENCVKNEENRRPASLVILQLGCPSGKLGSRMLRDKLPLLKPFLADVFTKTTSPRLLFTCANGRDLSVGVALAFFCMYYDDQGKAALINPPKVIVEANGKIANLIQEPRADIGKSLIRRRLAAIIEAIPWANPSRATLQAVNTLLMDQPE